MKEIIYLSVLTAVAFNLTACYKQSDILGGGEYLANKENNLVTDCHGDLISIKLKPSSADKFWKENSLARGTTDFVCKDYTPYSSNKVTDCQGNNIANQKGGLAQFKIRNNFPKYSTGEIVSYTSFNCKNGKVIPIEK